jgi:addiction module HigA family antidote
MPERIPTHPGAILREDMLPALGLTPPAVAKALGISRQMLNRILSEKAPVTPAMAVRLGKYCGNGPEFWANMQTLHDLAVAKRQLAAQVAKIPVAKAA